MTTVVPFKPRQKFRSDANSVDRIIDELNARQSYVDAVISRAKAIRNEREGRNNVVHI